MPFYFFTWSDEIIDHLAENDVTPIDFEEIVSHPESEGISRSSGNPIAFGYTDDGRLLCCVFRRLECDTIEPITAYEVGE
jgi:hypothetical protein